MPVLTKLTSLNHLTKTILSPIKHINNIIFRYFIISMHNKVLSKILLLLFSLALMTVIQFIYFGFVEIILIAGINVNLTIMTEIILVANLYFLFFFKKLFQNQLTLDLSHRFYFNNSPSSPKIFKFIEKLLSDHFTNIVIITAFATTICGLCIYHFDSSNLYASPVMILRSIMIIAVGVPIVEELLFRGYITSLIYKFNQKTASPKLSWISVILSIIIFSNLHQNVFPNFSLGFISLAIPPLIIASINELLRSFRAKWYLIISIHILSNGSVILFSLLSPKSLDIISFFYY